MFAVCVWVLALWNMVGLHFFTAGFGKRCEDDECCVSLVGEAVRAGVRSPAAASVRQGLDGASPAWALRGGDTEERKQPSCSELVVPGCFKPLRCQDVPSAQPSPF